MQSIVEIQGRISEFVYHVKRRYFSHQNQQWRTVDMHNNELDAEDLGLSFETGDKVVAYWDQIRRMWIPIAGGATDPMWCAQICECVLERGPGDCCIWRAKVKRIKPQDTWTTETLCDPPKITKSAWVLTECDDNLAIGPAEGWVRKIDEEVEITWTPTGLSDPITETLDLYEWCCWPPDKCPDTDGFGGTMNAEISFHHSEETCDEANGIGDLLMEYRDWGGDGGGAPPRNNIFSCGWHDGWFVEFKVPSMVPVRLTEMDYKVSGDDAWRFGYLRPDWLTGEPIAWFDDELNSISEPNEIRTAVFNGRIVVSADGFSPGGCRVLDDADGNPVEELVDRYYRLSVKCEGSGNLVDPCIQHLYPPGHPIYLSQDYLGNPGLNGGYGTSLLQDPDAPLESMEQALALEDGEGMNPWQEICSQDWAGEFDPDFGQSHVTTASLLPDASIVPDGAFNGIWPGMHLFCGCFDDVKNDLTCVVDKEGIFGGPGAEAARYKFNLKVTWAAN
jgi:hypothetical protein